MREWVVVNPAVPAWQPDIRYFLTEHAQDMNWSVNEQVSRALEVSAQATSFHLSAVAFSRVLEPGQEMEPIGLAVVTRDARRKHVGALRIVVHRDWRGRGIGNELLEQLLPVADGSKLERIEATPYVYPDDPETTERKRKLFESYGFEVEGVLRKAGRRVYHPYDIVDVLMMARVR